MTWYNIILQYICTNVLWYQYNIVLGYSIMCDIICIRGSDLCGFMWSYTMLIHLYVVFRTVTYTRLWCIHVDPLPYGVNHYSRMCACTRQCYITDYLLFVENRYGLIIISARNTCKTLWIRKQMSNASTYMRVVGYYVSYVTLSMFWQELCPPILLQPSQGNPWDIILFKISYHYTGI
jgi:hypothetical protein